MDPVKKILGKKKGYVKCVDCNVIITDENYDTHLTHMVVGFRERR